jgi:DNA-binding CsgD family transcriptional regulator/5-methylcytosine-specific restriction endonuclease McrA
MTYKRGTLKKEGKELLLRGYSVSEVAEMFNSSRDTVLTYNKKFWKVTLRKKMTDEQIQIAKQMIIDGYTYKEIAAVVGFTPSTIADKNIENWRLPYSDIQVSKKLVERYCLTCGKKFFVRSQKLKYDACNYCCKKCSHLGAIKVDKINKPIFRGYRWSYLSLEVRKKIPFCQRCLKTKNRLTVHHIKPWRLDGTNNRENLLVLCDSCHKYLEDASRVMFDLIGLEDSIKLIQINFSYRLEAIKRCLTKLNL